MTQRQNHLIKMNSGKHVFLYMEFRPTPHDCTLKLPFDLSSSVALSLLYTLFLSTSFLLPVWPLFEHFFLAVRLWGGRLMRVRVQVLFPKIHAIKRKQTHIHLQKGPSHIQPDIHQGAVICNKVTLCPGCGH